ncbi:MAG TPA: hypothetical protein ENN19_13920 [Chloroflexi bacterium]|nr:hypothetical protein [Chloroflexota bacterium]
MENTYLISSATEMAYDSNLRIGAGNFWQEEYVDEEGVKQRGVTAGLWLMVLDGSSQDQHVRVHVGQGVVFDEYVIKIVEIGQGTRAPFVRVAIDNGGQSGK